MNKCKFIKPDGNNCGSYALKQDNYCFFHSEATSIARKEAVNKGGYSKKRNYGNDEVLRFTNADDILKLLEQTANDLRTNKTNTGIANALNCIAGTAMRAMELKYLEYRRRPTKFDNELDKLMY